MTTVYSYGFEDGGLDSWAANGTTFVAPNNTTGTAHTGTRSIQFSLNAATAVVRTFTGLTVGNSYTISGWTYSINSGNTGKIGVTGIGDSAGVALAVNTWTQVSYTFSATATSHEVRLVKVSGGVNWDDIALVDNGAPLIPSGAATGGYDFTGSASGSRTSSGTATGGYDFTGSAAGVTPALAVPFGTATGGYDFTGSATGTAPIISVGSATGSYDFSGTASGVTPPEPPFYIAEVLKLEVDTTGSGGWSDILDYLSEISFTRDELDVGTITATVASASYDPAKSDVLRPGRGLKLSVLVSGTWSPIFTGQIAQASVAYDPAQVDPEHRATITLTGVDKTSVLANASTTTGVGSLHDLAYVLGNMIGDPITWNINGSSAALSSATTIPVETSVLDQVAIARDSELGYAWVDRSGVLQGWSANQISTANRGVLDESVYNRALSIDYDTTRCINSVVVAYVHEDADNPGSTLTDNYGPYVNQASINEWGTYSATFTVQGSSPSASAVDAYAQSILAANAIPSVRVNSVVVPIKNAADLSRALLDLYDLVTVQNASVEVDADMRIVGVSHTITPDGWLMQVNFATDGTFAAPTVSAGQQLGQVDNTARTALDQAVSAMQQAQDALAQANQAADFAQAAAQVYYQPTKPIPGSQGDIWYDTDDGNRMRVYQDSASDFVDATSSYLITPNGKLTITPNGVSATDASNATTFVLDAATGAVTMKGSLTAGSSVTGATITGSTVQSSTTASRGIKFNSTAFIAYNTSGSPTFSIDAATGNVAMLGTLTSGSTITGASISAGSIVGTTYNTASSGARLTLVTSGFTGGGAIVFTNSSEQLAGYITGQSTGILFQGALGDAITLTGDVQITPKSSGSVILSGTTSITAPLTVAGLLNNFSGLVVDSSQAFIRDPVGGAAYCRASGGVLTLAGGSVSLPATGVATVVSTAGFNSTASATLIRSSSGAKYKIDIHRLEDAPGSMGKPILDIDPVRYRDRLIEEARYTDKDMGEARWFIGWTAEQFIDAGWNDLVIRDHETGEPDGLMYDRVLPALVLEVRNRLEAIEDRLNALEN